MSRCSYQSLGRQTRRLSKVTYITLNFVFITGLAFMVSPDGYQRAREFRESHVLVSLQGDSRIRDLASNLTTRDFDAIKCIAMNGYFEARGEGDGGLDRVADVVLNRASDKKKYPDGPCQVVTEKNQFSWYTDGRDHTIKDHLLYQHIYDLSYNRYVYRRAGVLSDETNGALHYHADYVSPHWHWSFLGQFGHHLFYR